MLLKKIDSRIFVAAVFLALLFSVTSIQIAYARVNNNDMVMSLSQQQDNVLSRLIIPAGTVATSTQLVDLSNVTNFRHVRSTGTVEISQIRFDWSTDTAATTTIKVGVIASTSPSGNVSDVYWFDSVSFASAIGTNFTGRQSAVLDYAVSAVKLDLSSGLPASYLTGDSSLSQSSYATTTTIKSPSGFANPGVGDLVAQVYDQKGTATTSISTIYRVK